VPTVNEIKNIYHVIAGAEAKKIEPLKAGFSNYSYLINQHYVLRLKKATEDRFYDAQKEDRVIRAIAPLKISESVAFFNEKDGTKLSLYLHRTQKMIGDPAPEQLSLVAKALRKLHRAKIRMGFSFDLFERFKYYRSQCADFVDTHYERKTIASVERFYNEEPFVLCHNDVVNGNLLFRKRKLFLIDFEYAADNNPLFDLASFLSENDIEDERVRRSFLKSYFNKRCDEKTYRRVQRFIAFQDILWYYWSQMHYIRTKQQVYKRIAHHKWEAIIKNASSK
jgi:thiamine kinase-like enzyme